MRDVVIVGGEHNGLACAAYLARAGLDVVVLARRPVLGGAAVTEESWPGSVFGYAPHRGSRFRVEALRPYGRTWVREDFHPGPTQR